jgi:hypothetical protein
VVASPRFITRSTPGSPQVQDGHQSYQSWQAARLARLPRRLGHIAYRLLFPCRIHTSPNGYVDVAALNTMNTKMPMLLVMQHDEILTPVCSAWRLNTTRVSCESQALLGLLSWSNES